MTEQIFDMMVAAIPYQSACPGSSPYDAVAKANLGLMLSSKKD